ncbi:hypothetical protein [Clostridium sp. Marseille-Q7071]
MKHLFDQGSTRIYAASCSGCTATCKYSCGGCGGNCRGHCSMDCADACRVVIGMY